MCITDKLKEKGFVSTKNLSDWQEQQLQDAVRKGEAVRLKNGIYADIDALANTMVDIRMIVPGGILCLWSAWSVYNLTTQIPNLNEHERSFCLIIRNFNWFINPTICSLSGQPEKMCKDTIFLSLIWNVLYAMQSNTETKSALM